MQESLPNPFMKVSCDISIMSLATAYLCVKACHTHSNPCPNSSYRYIVTNISMVSDQNGISRQYNMLEICPSGLKPLISVHHNMPHHMPHTPISARSLHLYSVVSLSSHYHITVSTNALQKSLSYYCVHKCPSNWSFYECKCL